MSHFKSLRLPRPAVSFQPRVWGENFRNGIRTLFTWPEVWFSVGIALLTMMLMLYTGFSISGGLVPVLILMTYLFGVYAFSAGGTANNAKSLHRKWMLQQVTLGLAVFVLFTASVEVLDYMLTEILVLPEWDARFAAWDMALGFHWLYWYHVVMERPWLHHILYVAYNLLSIEVVFLLIALPLSGHIRAGRTLLLRFMVSVLITILVGLLMPAKGAFVYYHLPIALHTAYVPVMAGLRAGTIHAVNLLHAQGLVVFPSFHSALAEICAVSAWSWKRWRVLFLLLNITIVVSAIPFGGHYLVDVLAGFVVALLTGVMVRPHRTTASGIEAQA